MTKDALKKEILRCGKDPVYFIKKYVRIQHPVRGLIRFELFDYQERLIRDFVSERFNIILKSRQIGISETSAAYALWLCLFRKDKNIIVMASKSETAKNIIRKVRTAIKHLPKWLMLTEVDTNNVLSVEFANGSRIRAISTSSDAGRSEAVSLLIVDEAAWIDNFDELWTGIYPTVAAGGRAIVLSTPRGVGNKFHQLYVGAETKENEFKHVKLMWWVHPERISDLEDDPYRPGFKTSTWYRNEIKSGDMGPREIAQELECSFISSGETVIPTSGLEWIHSGIIKPNKMEWWDRNLWVWQEPVHGKRYLTSVDVSRGDAADFSAAHWFDIDTMEQVAEYYAKVKPDELAEVLDKYGREYFNSTMIVENNNVGLACIEHLKLKKYPALYFSNKSEKEAGEVVNMEWLDITMEKNLIPGFSTTKRTKPLIVAKLEEYIRNKLMHIRSDRTYNELRTYIWKGGSAQAIRGYNDDAVTAAAIAAWIKDTFIAPSFASAELQEKLINSISREGNLNTSIEGASKSPDYREVIVRKPQTHAPMSVTLPGGQSIDFSWLITTG